MTRFNGGIKETYPYIAEPITKSNSTLLVTNSLNFVNQIYVGIGGVLNVKTNNGSTCAFNVTSFSTLKLTGITQVLSLQTTANSLVGMI